MDDGFADVSDSVSKSYTAPFNTLWVYLHEKKMMPWSTGQAEFFDCVV